LAGRLAGDRVERTGRHVFSGTVGAVVCASDGSLLVAGTHTLDGAGEESLYRLEDDGTVAVIDWPSRTACALTSRAISGSPCGARAGCSRPG
jgi:hypothetical protein